MYTLNYHITIGAYTVATVDSVTIKKSVEQLVDTAIIVLPGTSINKTLEVEDKIAEGDSVLIKLGYDDNPVTEFIGYVNAIQTDDGTLKIECEDELYVLRKKNLNNAEYKNITLSDLLVKVMKQAGGYTISCDYSFTWEKFTIFNATAYDVLKKVQEETKANVYFKNGTVHIHPQYSEIENEIPVVFDFAVNIEKSDLKYMTAKQRKTLIEVTATTADGKQVKEIFGDTGGAKETLNCGTSDKASMKKLAEERYKQSVFDGYEGTFKGWLLPYVEPAYKIKIKDAEYPRKDGVYYVVATEIKFSKSGGERTITPGKKIG